eukprot:349912-Chlamydomonas_euryale.AAC.11
MASALDQDALPESRSEPNQIEVRSERIRPHDQAKPRGASSHQPAFLLASPPVGRCAVLLAAPDVLAGSQAGGWADKRMDRLVNRYEEG